MTTDPISDMLLTIRNGLKARLVQVVTPASNLKAEIARVMKASGYIQDVLMTDSFPRKLVITLKYSESRKYLEAYSFRQALEASAHAM